ncbi:MULTISPECIES: alkaline shock response membrane anchor protein AmaP [unclassified Saccharothrix]|uniref:alkaline shock response membrane anchor protein AmaP n=1 Tax=unclassified Saccharothrix TaxID=2593673 RepID=UPI00307DD229
MITRSYRTERVCATLLGGLALLVGGGALALNLLRVDRPLPDLDLLRPYLLWVRIGALVLGVLAVVVGLRWAWRALTPERHPDLYLEDGLTVTSDALAQAVATDALQVTGVAAARVKVIGDPALRVSLTLRQGADVRRVWQDLDGVLTRARDALGLPALPAAVRLDLAARAKRRVR